MSARARSNRATAKSCSSSRTFPLPTSGNSRDQRSEISGSKTNVSSWMVLLSVSWFLPLGCARREAEPIRLVLISPHRDEIREEVALGFQDWFAARTEVRITAARQAMEGWVADQTAERERAVERAFHALFHDWKKQDLGEVPSA